MFNELSELEQKEQEEMNPAQRLAAPGPTRACPGGPITGLPGFLEDGHHAVTPVAWKDASQVLETRQAREQVREAIDARKKSATQNGREKTP